MGQGVACALAHDRALRLRVATVERSARLAKAGELGPERVERGDHDWTRPWRLREQLGEDRIHRRRAARDRALERDRHRRVRGALREGLTPDERDARARERARRGRVQDARLGLGRDPVRTPMPWNASAHAGFSTAEPWLPLNADWATRNVAAHNAMLTLHHDLLALRRKHAALVIGEFRLIEAEGDVLAYERTHGDERIVVALNMGATEQTVPLPPGETLLTTLPASHSSREEQRPTGTDRAPYTLAPNEAVILRVTR